VAAREKHQAITVETAVTAMETQVNFGIPVGI
jgi:hypothetical protein